MSTTPQSSHPAQPDLNPALSVIVSCFGDLKILARALDSIFAQDLPAVMYEVLVLVGGDLDDRLPYLRALQEKRSLRIIEISNRRQAVALNEAVTAARGRIVVFTRDDLVLDPENFAARLAAHASRESRVVYGPAFVPGDDGDSLIKQWARSTVAEEVGFREEGRSWPLSINFAPVYSIPLKSLRACGGFDEDLSILSHNELWVRLTKAGEHPYFESGAISHLADVPSVRRIVRRKAPAIGEDEVLILRKHPELRPRSEIARLTNLPSWKWLAIQAAARSPISPELLMGPLFACADQLRSLPLMRRIGLTLLRIRVALGFLRGAVKAVGWRRLRTEFGMRLPVFMYHHVGPPQPDSEPALFVSAARFEAHLRFFSRKGYKGIRASDWTAWVSDAKPLPEESVLLTFDDAIADLYEYAFPLLERYGFNAVVFVPTNCVGEGNLWNHSLGYKWRPCMNAEQIRHWASQGFEFGAHSRNHPDLTQLSASDLQSEIAGSRDDLEKITGSPVTSFAYPYGHYNADATQCVAQEFDAGFTIEEGMNSLRTNRSLLRRCAIFEWDTMLDLELMLRLGWNPIRRLKLRQRYRGLKRRLRIDKLG